LAHESDVLNKLTDDSSAPLSPLEEIESPQLPLAPCLGPDPILDELNDSASSVQIEITKKGVRVISEKESFL